MPNFTTISKGTFHDNIAKAIVDNGAEREYRICMRTKFDPQKIRVENLGLLLDVAGLTVLEAYSGNKFRPRISEEDRAMLSNCQKLTSPDYSELTMLIRELTDVWWDDMDLPTVKSRLLEAIRRRTLIEQRHDPTNERFTEHMALVWGERKVRLDLDEMPEAAYLLDVSLHWLLALPDSNYFFCYSARAQHFYDEYMLTPPRTREILRQTVNSIAKTKSLGEA